MNYVYAYENSCTLLDQLHFCMTFASQKVNNKHVRKDEHKNSENKNKIITIIKPKSNKIFGRLPKKVMACGVSCCLYLIFIQVIFRCIISTYRNIIADTPVSQPLLQLAKICHVSFTYQRNMREKQCVFFVSKKIEIIQK